MPDTRAVRIGGDEPQPTPAAREARVSGLVILELTIERDGRVSGGRVLKPLPFGLTEAAIEAVRTWKYQPARHRGKVVRSVEKVVLHFPLP